MIWALVMADFTVTSPAVAIRLTLVPERLAPGARSIVWLGATSEKSAAVPMPEMLVPLMLLYSMLLCA